MVAPKMGGVDAEKKRTRRVVVLPKDVRGEKLKVVLLTDPATGKEGKEYALGKTGILEANWFKNKHASWFVGNNVISDGGLHLYTKINPLFFVLPMLAGCGPNKMEQQGVFCTIEHLMESARLPREVEFECLLKGRLGEICDAKEAGGEVYYRYNEEKAKTWVGGLVQKLTLSFKSLSSAFALLDEEGLKNYSIGYLGEYLPKALLEKFGLSVEKAERERENDAKKRSAMLKQQQHMQKKVEEEERKRKERGATLASFQKKAAPQPKKSKVAFSKDNIRMQKGQKSISSFFRSA